MFSSRDRVCICVAAAVALSGCITPQAVVFSTKSNVGLDIETTPPISEVSISRREVVMGPTFEGGEHPPVIASFRSDQRAAFNFMFGGSSIFAGGGAASILADENDGAHEQIICLSAEPKYVRNGKPGKPPPEVSWPKQGHVRPFVFGTDTMLGFKVGWSSSAPAAIESVRIGYSRKEFAAAPVILAPGTADQCGVGQFVVRVTPFFAEVQRSSELQESATRGGPQVNYVQLFATADAAMRLVAREEIRRVLIERMEPGVKTLIGKYGPGESGANLRKLIGRDAAKRAVLADYLKDRNLNVTPTSFLFDEQFAKEREAALADADLIAALNAAHDAPPENESPPAPAPELVLPPEPEPAPQPEPAPRDVPPPAPQH